jgi:hypothetical protein
MTQPAAAAFIPDAATAAIPADVDYHTLTKTFAYKLLESENTNTCISVVDIIEFIVAILRAADEYVGIHTQSDEDVEKQLCRVDPPGITATRTITSGKSQDIFQGLIDVLGAEFKTGDNPLKSAFELIRKFNGIWEQLFDSCPIDFNYPDGLRVTAGMILKAKEKDFMIPVHDGKVAIEFSLPFEDGNLFATFIFPKREFAHLPLPTIKDIIAKEKKDRRLMNERHYQLCNQLDDEIRKVDKSYCYWHGRPFECGEEYKPPTDKIAELYAEYLKNPLQEDVYLDELIMPTFTMTCETDILRELKSSPLWDLFMADDSRVKNFIGILVRFCNKTTVTFNELGGTAESKTDAEFKDRCCGGDDEPIFKKFISIYMNSLFCFEINHFSHDTGNIINHFSGKVVSPIPA